MSIAQQISLMKLFVAHFPIDDWESYEVMLRESTRLFCALTTRTIIRALIKEALTDPQLRDKLESSLGAHRAKELFKSCDVKREAK